MSTFCKRCSYDLRESHGACSECGRAFDPSDPHTYDASRSRASRRLLRCAAAVALILAIACMRMCWLLGEWRANARFIELPYGVSAKVGVATADDWPLRYAPDRFGFVRDRVYLLGLTGSTWTDSSLRSVAGLHSLRRLDLIGTGVSDGGLRMLHGLTSLEIVTLRGANISDSGLECLGNLRGLSTLLIYDTPVTGTGLGGFRADGLKSVCFVESPLSDAGARCLGRLRSIEFLTIDSTSITDDGLATIATLTCLRRLTLTNNRITGAGLSCAAAMTNLESLDLSGEGVTDSAVPILSKLAWLKGLNISDTHISAAGYHLLWKALPRTGVWYSSHAANGHQHYGIDGAVSP